MTKEQIMAAVIEMARRNLTSNAGLTPITAVVARGGEIVGRGSNTAVRDFDPTAHAEVIAIRDACSKLRTWDLSGCDLYAINDPCPMCVGAMYFARVDRLYLGNARSDSVKRGMDLKYLFREIALPPEMRVLPSQQLLPDEARAVMEEWARTPSYREYCETLAPNTIYHSGRSGHRLPGVVRTN